MAFQLSFNARKRGAIGNYYIPVCVSIDTDDPDAVSAKLEEICDKMNYERDFGYRLMKVR